MAVLVGLVGEPVELGADLADLGDDHLLVGAPAVGEVVHERTLHVDVEAARAEERHPVVQHVGDLDVRARGCSPRPTWGRWLPSHYSPWTGGLDEHPRECPTHAASSRGTGQASGSRRAAQAPGARVRGLRADGAEMVGPISRRGGGRPRRPLQPAARQSRPDRGAPATRRQSAAVAALDRRPDRDRAGDQRGERDPDLAAGRAESPGPPGAAARRRALRACRRGGPAASRHQEAGAHNLSGEGHGQRRRRRHGSGWEIVHVAVDDHSRVAYVELLPDEHSDTARGFVRRAVGVVPRAGRAGPARAHG